MLRICFRPMEGGMKREIVDDVLWFLTVASVAKENEELKKIVSENQKRM